MKTPSSYSGSAFTNSIGMEFVLMPAGEFDMGSPWNEAGRSDNSGSKTHDVGQKKPNPWGLYDMHGNVWEWVQDNWHDNYNDAPTDGSSWERKGSDRVNRGGGWYYNTGVAGQGAAASTVRTPVATPLVFAF
jgi:formylglycine-generating enzyme required for sulfatase activity